MDLKDKRVLEWACAVRVASALFPAARGASWTVSGREAANQVSPEIPVLLDHGIAASPADTANGPSEDRISCVRPASRWTHRR